MSYGSSFNLSRDANAGTPERSDGDTAGAFRIPTTFGNSATLDLAATVDISRALRGLLGDSSGLRRALDRITQLDVDRLMERRSQFTRPGFDPGGGYIFGLGGLGSFTSQNGRLANAASHSEQDRVNMVFRLPLSVQVTSAYGRRISSSYFLRGSLQQVQRTTDTDWPSVSARWLWSPHGGPLSTVLTSLTASLGYQLRSSVGEVPSLEGGGSQSGLNFLQETRSQPYSVSVTWAPRLTTAVTRSSDHTHGEQSGNTTLGDRTTTALDASFTFRPPQDILPLKSDVRTVLRWSYSANAICIQRSGETNCIPIADSRRTEYNLTMDTEMPPNVNAGLTAAYVITDERQLDRKFAQLTLTASVRVYFNAGELR